MSDRQQHDHFDRDDRGGRRRVQHGAKNAQPYARRVPRPLLHPEVQGGRDDQDPRDEGCDESLHEDYEDGEGYRKLGVRD
ncbi:hypothetical protein F25303_3798 [Fusarium sp. NRRL 25303]|nr:hypothetical protein F25303_3798 [Fusarium sp. NRRL 25303]